MIVGVTLAMFMYYNAPNACAWGHCMGVCVSSASCYGDCICIKKAARFWVLAPVFIRY